MTNVPLEHDKDSPDDFDFVLIGDYCWITVKNLSVYIKKTDEGVAIDIYPNHDACQEPISGTWVLFSEAEDCE